MGLHFSREEFAQRRQRVCVELQQRGLGALLYFAG